MNFMINQKQISNKLQKTNNTMIHYSVRQILSQIEKSDDEIKELSISLNGFNIIIKKKF